MSKPRFSRASVSQSLDQFIESAIYAYEEAAKKPYDPRNGTAQIPKSAPPEAWYEYGRISALQHVLEEVQS